MRRFLSILSGILLLGAAFTAPAMAAPDPRICGGNAGVLVWEDANRGGTSALLCFTKYGPWVTYNNLNNIHTNLGFGASWNDRISSYTTMNNIGHSIRFYLDAGFTSPQNRIVTTTDNEYVPNVGVFYSSAMIDGFNDRISSINFVP